MTSQDMAMRTVLVEREIAAPPEKIWRALTEPYLLAEWLMSNDFKLEIGHRFKLSAEWGAVDCQVIDIEMHKMLCYSWDAMGLESVVTWTLTALGEGTLLRMEQEGFRPDQEQAYQGAKIGWQRFFGQLEQIISQLDDAKN